MVNGISGFIEIGVPVKVEYCDNVINPESSTAKLDRLRFPYYTNSTSVEVIEISEQTYEEVKG